MLLNDKYTGEFYCSLKIINNLINTGFSDFLDLEKRDIFGLALKMFNNFRRVRS